MNRRVLPPMMAVLLILALACAAPKAAGAAPAADETVMTEDFEGAWPGTKWTVTDLSNDGYSRYWGKEDYEPESTTYPTWAGNWSAWPAAGGVHRVDASTKVYPPNMYTQMRYGPLDLSNATAATLTFWLWFEIEVYEEGDYFYMGTSADGTNFAPAMQLEGSQDWELYTVDLTPYAGDASVWLRWDFVSDWATGLRGAFVDNITVTQTPLLVKPAVAVSRDGNDVVLQWAAVAQATGYEVWRGVNTPYFAPGDNCASAPSACTAVSTNSYRHVGGLGSTANNTTYVVRATKGAVKSSPSNRTAEFEFSLTKGG